MYSPFLFTVRCDLSQSASGTRQLPLPPPGLSQKEEEEKRRKRELKRLTDRKSRHDRL
jgi:hypothetical protein